MNYYVDVLINPDSAMRLNVLLNIVYSTLHKALSDLHSTSIGISFPRYKILLGNVLRIHGNEASLNVLQGLNWISTLSDYCQVSEITCIPAGVRFRNVSRIQTTMSQSKLTRLLKRGSITEEEVRNYQTTMLTKGLDNPYIELISGSSGHKYRRYIKFGGLLEEPVTGQFDQFGLSKIATIPWFD